jgi:hypothetical protein
MHHVCHALVCISNLSTQLQGLDHRCENAPPDSPVSSSSSDDDIEGAMVPTCDSGPFAMPSIHAHAHAPISVHVEPEEGKSSELPESKEDGNSEVNDIITLSTNLPHRVLEAFDTGEL